MSRNHRGRKPRSRAKAEPVAALSMEVVAEDSASDVVVAGADAPAGYHADSSVDELRVETEEHPEFAESREDGVETHPDGVAIDTPADSRAESSGESLFRQAREAERAGDTIQAIALYRQLILEEPDNIKARNNLGCLHDAAGQSLLALEQYEAARAVAPDNVDVLLNIGDTLMALGRYEAAEKDLKRAQKLDPSRADVHLHVGILYFKRGLYAQADVELRRSVEIDSANASAYFYRGEALNQLGKVDDAIELLLKSVQLQPRNSRAYYLMGILYDRKRLPEQAMAMYRKAREISAA